MGPSMETSTGSAQPTPTSSENNQIKSDQLSQPQLLGKVRATGKELILGAYVSIARSLGLLSDVNVFQRCDDYTPSNVAARLRPAQPGDATILAISQRKSRGFIAIRPYSIRVYTNLLKGEMDLRSIDQTAIESVCADARVLTASQLTRILMGTVVEYNGFVQSTDLRHEQLKRVIGKFQAYLAEIMTRMLLAHHVGGPSWENQFLNKSSECSIEYPDILLEAALPHELKNPSRLASFGAELLKNIGMMEMYSAATRNQHGAMRSSVRLFVLHSGGRPMPSENCPPDRAPRPQIDPLSRTLPPIPSADSRNAPNISHDANTRATMHRGRSSMGNTTNSNSENRRSSSVSVLLRKTSTVTLEAQMKGTELFWLVNSKAFESFPASCPEFSPEVRRRLDILCPRLDLSSDLPVVVQALESTSASITWELPRQSIVFFQVPPDTTNFNVLNPETRGAAFKEELTRQVSAWGSRRAHSNTLRSAIERSLSTGACRRSASNSRDTVPAWAKAIQDRRPDLGFDSPTPEPSGANPVIPLSFISNSNHSTSDKHRPTKRNEGCPPSPHRSPAIPSPSQPQPDTPKLARWARTSPRSIPVKDRMPTLFQSSSSSQGQMDITNSRHQSQQPAVSSITLKSLLPSSPRIQVHRERAMPQSAYRHGEGRTDEVPDSQPVIDILQSSLLPVIPPPVPHPSRKIPSNRSSQHRGHELGGGTMLIDDTSQKEEDRSSCLPKHRGRILSSSDDIQPHATSINSCHVVSLPVRPDPRRSHNARYLPISRVDQGGRSSTPPSSRALERVNGQRTETERTTHHQMRTHSAQTPVTKMFQQQQHLESSGSMRNKQQPGRDQDLSQSNRTTTNKNLTPDLSPLLPRPGPHRPSSGPSSDPIIPKPRAERAERVLNIECQGVSPYPQPNRYTSHPLPHPHHGRTTMTREVRVSRSPRKPSTPLRRVCQREPEPTPPRLQQPGIQNPQNPVQSGPPSLSHPLSGSRLSSDYCDSNILSRGRSAIGSTTATATNDSTPTVSSSPYQERHRTTRVGNAARRDATPSDRTRRTRPMWKR